MKPQKAIFITIISSIFCAIFLTIRILQLSHNPLSHISRHFQIQYPTKQGVLPDRLEANIEETSRIKFYLDDRFNDNQLNKFLSPFESDSEDGFDYHFSPYQCEHMSDYYFTKLLQRHKNRVQNLEEADLIFLNVSFATEFLFGIGRISDIDNHVRYLMKRSKPHVKIVFLTSNWKLGRFMKNLKRTINYNANRFILCLGDEWFGKEFSKKVRKLIIPYKATNGLEKKRDLESTARSFSIYFAGSCNRTGQGKGRDKIMKNLMDFPGAKIECGDKAHSHNNAFLKQMVDSNVKSYQQSDLCLIPSGDTPTSRRLFDAMAAGCVPIYFGNRDKILNSLPFRDRIPWEDLIEFEGDMERFATEKDFEQLRERLRVYRERKNLFQIQINVREVFEEHLSYLSPSFLDSLLNEISLLPPQQLSTWQRVWPRLKIALGPKSCILIWTMFTGLVLWLR